MANTRLAENKLMHLRQDSVQSSSNASAMDECLVCKKVDTEVTLMSSSLRDELSVELQVRAEDIRKLESQLAQNIPRFVHKDCLTSFLNRYVRNNVR